MLLPTVTPIPASYPSEPTAVAEVADTGEVVEEMAVPTQLPPTPEEPANTTNSLTWMFVGALILLLFGGGIIFYLTQRA